jgi:hypothetical protein
MMPVASPQGAARARLSSLGRRALMRTIFTMSRKLTAVGWYAAHGII